MGCFDKSDNDEAKKLSKKIDNDIKQDKIAYRATHRLLLLGNNLKMLLISSRIYKVEFCV